MTRTIADLMRDGAAPEAIAQARRCHEWRTIANGLPGEIDVESVAAPLLATAVAEHEIWGIRDAARIRAERGDDAGAHAALEAGFAMLVRGPDPTTYRRTRGYEWVLLGRGGDAELQRRCLEAGLAHARARGDGDDLLELANAWCAVIDRTAGIELIREVERLGTVRPWAIANAWDHLGEPAEVQRVLATALAAAATLADALHVARAWGSHAELARRAVPPTPDVVADLVGRVVAGLERGEALATGIDDWLQLAETAFDLKVGSSIRRALDFAAALGEAPARVSAGYKQWLGDDAMAARLGPRGVRPDALRPRLRTASRAATTEPLFDALRMRVTPAQLSSVAGADYGMDYAKHLAALEDICATGLVPDPLPWVPHEVCALTRWDEGERTDHLVRALCVTLVCLSDGELATNGAILLESCRVLGLDPVPFFAWCLETADGDGELAVATLLLVLAGVPAPIDLDALERELSGSLRVALWRELLAASTDPELALLAASLTD